MKEYREANKDKISADATSYSEEHNRTEYHRDYYANNLERSRIKSALSSNICYHKDPKKSRVESTARSKACYHMDPEKSRAESTARSKACYHMDPEKSRTESNARSKRCYHANLEKSRADTAARSKESYSTNIDTIRSARKVWRRSLYILCKRLAPALNYNAFSPQTHYTRAQHLLFLKNLNT